MEKAVKTSDAVLRCLEKNRGRFVSGAEMAGECNISRNAIWKAVNTLREKGYAVEAISKKGYRLSEDSDIISAEGIKLFLSEDSIKKVCLHVFESIDSTSDKAKEMALKGEPGGTVVVSSSQTRGRGRSDHKFFSPAGGLYMSMIISPLNIKSTDSNSITAEIGNAVTEAIKELTGVALERRGINDLYLGEKKICGILIESGSEFDSQTLQWLVVGIGINFDTDVSLFPPELKDRASSLFKPGRAPITKNRLIAEIINRIGIVD